MNKLHTWMKCSDYYWVHKINLETGIHFGDTTNRNEVFSSNLSLTSPHIHTIYIYISLYAINITQLAVLSFMIKYPILLYSLIILSSVIGQSISLPIHTIKDQQYQSTKSKNNTIYNY